MDYIEEYKSIVENPEALNVYDGRNKGVDIYICNKCGKHFATRYKDKGVTPFTMRCKESTCNGDMVHKCTISEETAKEKGYVVHNWVRPTLKHFKLIVKENNIGLIQHLLGGGLILE